jgi:hypothetical protein
VIDAQHNLIPLGGIPDISKAFGFSVGVVVAPPDPQGLASGLVPRFEDANAVLLAASILGATIMPHAPTRARSWLMARPAWPPPTTATSTTTAADRSSTRLTLCGYHFGPRPSIQTKATPTPITITMTTIAKIIGSRRRHGGGWEVGS